MPTRPHSHGEGSEEPELPARSRPKATHVGSVREASQTIAEVAKAGRVKDGGATRAGPPGGSRPPTEDLMTHKTGTPGGAPEGHPTRVESDDDAATRRSIEMENSAAAALASSGWQVKQNPTPDEVAQARQTSGDIGDPKKNPDYLLEGRVFDCYSPTKPTKNARGVWSEVQIKIKKLQTQRVVVNLEDWKGNMTALRRQFADWPIPKLKEVKAVTPDGDIVQIDLPEYSE